MKRFKHILFFADGVTGPSSALERAVSLAASNDSRLTVFDVVPEQDPATRMQERLDFDINQILRGAREAELDELAAPLRESGTALEARVVNGRPFVEVIRAVLNDGYDLVVKAAKPPDSFVKRVLGSTDLHLLRKCPCPIWIDQPGAATPYRTVLAAVDPVASGQEDSARLIMDLATSLAEREAATLAVIHAWSLPSESLLRTGRAGISNAELELLLEGTRERHRAGLEALLGEYGIHIQDPRVHLVKGDPAPSIQALSKELKADLVVMGTLGRRAIPGIFIGNTAEDVLQTTQASVLAIKPYGFVSPVTSA